MEVTPRRSPRYVAVLAVASGLVLIGGWLARPPDIAQAPPRVPSETELQELAHRAQRRSLESMTAYFADLATGVRPSFAYIPSARVSGIAWDQTQVVTGPIGVDREAQAVNVRTASGERRAEGTLSRRLPLSILKVALDPPARVAHRAVSLPQTGDWIVTVWQTDRGPAFSPATFREPATTTCGGAEVHEVVSSVALSHHMIGGGIFNLDRELLGVILPCGDHVAAIEPASIDEMLMRATMADERLLALYGVLFSAFSQDERSYFTDGDGVFVREVWIGTPGEAADLRPGDVVVAVNGEAVTRIDHLQMLMTHRGAVTEVRVQRGSRTEMIRIEPDVASGESRYDATSVGLVLEPAEPPYRIETLVPGSPAARAGLQAGDRLLRINRNTPRSRAQAERALTNAASAAIMLEIQRDRRRIAVVIPTSTMP